MVSNFELFSFGFVSDFDIRISDLVAALNRGVRDEEMIMAGHRDVHRIGFGIGDHDCADADFSLSFSILDLLRGAIMWSTALKPSLVCAHAAL
jgi:hypothetical protein